MIVVDDVCLSDEIASEHFVCDLKKCKGACCFEEGEAGAPLNADETTILEEILPKISPFLTEEGLQTIAQKGTSIVLNGQTYTPTINNKACVYISYTEDGTAMCGIERAQAVGAVDFLKPISCHLYPIKVKEYDIEGERFDGLYYHEWHICSDACALGASLQIPLYRFLKGGLVRKYGADWYQRLVETIEHDAQTTETD